MTRENSTQDDLADPLGIARTDIARTPADALPDATGPGADRRRRERALGETEAEPSGDANPNGVSGIDMGYGGDGTDIKSR